MEEADRDREAIPLNHHHYHHHHPSLVVLPNSIIKKWRRAKAQQGGTSLRLRLLDESTRAPHVHLPTNTIMIRITLLMLVRTVPRTGAGVITLGNLVDAMV